MNTPVTTIDAKTFAIGVLGITACVLFVGLLLITLLPAPAYAIGQSDRAGDYIMITQQLTNAQEGCLIIDAASRQMTLFALNGANKQLQIIHPNIDLNQLRPPRAGQPGRP